MGITVVGTGHILQKSVDDVKKALSENCPSFVAVELDVRRFRALEEVDFQPEKYRKDISFKDVLAGLLGGGSFPVFVQGVLGLVQKDLGEKYGISPGSDMCTAVLSAREIGAVVVLIDRDIEITMNRLLAVPFRELWSLVSSRAGDETRVVAGLLNNNIEGILEGENLKTIIEEFRKRLPGIYGALIDERDQYMAYNLSRIQQKNPEKNVVAVAGAGHKAGIEKYLAEISAGYAVDMPGLSKMKRTSFVKVLFIASLIFFAFFLIKTESLFRRK